MTKGKELPMATFKTPVAFLALAIATGIAQANTESININQADAAALESLNGVGPATAEAIIEDRKANGAYDRIESLTRVNGIGDAKLESLKGRVVLE
jgi:competence protein ComEA